MASVLGLVPLASPALAAALTITCPANITTGNAINQTGAFVTYPAPTVSGGVLPVTVVVSPASGSFFPVGTTTLTATATDSASSTVTCTFTIRVNDTQPPSITCPANITANETSPGGAVVTFAPTATDNLPGVTVISSPASGSFFPVGTTTVTATATDTSANTKTCSFTVTVRPLGTIASFSPGGGAVGSTVVITGTNLTGTTAVKFNGTSAAVFTVDSPTQITVTVPAGASSGPITVTTPAGTATSPSAFLIKHARSVSLTLSGKMAKGTVSVTDGFAPCASGVQVKVQHLRQGDWKTVGSTLTQANGSYKVGGLTDPGKYRTIAKKTTLSSGDVCGKNISPKDTKRL